MMVDWFALDRALAGRLRRRCRPRWLFAALARSGDSYVFFLLAAAVWQWGDKFNPAVPSLAVFVLLAILFTAFIVLFIKWVVQRERPAGDWGGIYRSHDPYSFPSGHASRAGLLAVLSLGGPLWLALPVCCWALLVSLARIVMGVHYPSDVLAGFLLGMVLGAILHFFRPLLALYMI